MNKSVKLKNKLSRFWKLLGPGLVTGASDDDPSGIATYSQAGAAYGLSTLWTSLIAFPLMAAIQQMCARIGLVTSHGLTGALKNNYPRPILYVMLLFSFPAIVMNIGADIAGMGAVGNLLFPAIDATYFSVLFTILLLGLIIYCNVYFNGAISTFNFFKRVNKPHKNMRFPTSGINTIDMRRKYCYTYSCVRH